MLFRSYGTGNCRALWTCYNACEDSPCVQACVDATDRAGLDLFFAIFDGIDTQCDDALPESEWLTCANAALNDECAPAYAACQADAS